MVSSRASQLDLPMGQLLVASGAWPHGPLFFRCRWAPFAKCLYSSLFDSPSQTRPGACCSPHGQHFNCMHSIDTLIRSVSGRLHALSRGAQCSSACLALSLAHLSKPDQAYASSERDQPASKCEPDMKDWEAVGLPCTGKPEQCAQGKHCAGSHRHKHSRTCVGFS